MRDLTTAELHDGHEDDLDNPLRAAEHRMPPRKYAAVAPSDCETCGGALDQAGCCYRCEGGM